MTNFTKDQQSKALDLFCGAGGASKGLHEAGFEMMGIDINAQPDYPFEFVKCDVFDLPMEFFEEFDFIWASPPCQGYIHTNKFKEGYDRLIPKTRELLDRTKKPYVIENVPSDNIRKDLFLCGEMFNLKIIRHRFFEINGFHAVQLKHRIHKGLAKDDYYIQVFSGGKRGSKPTFEQQKEAMKIDWIKSRTMLYEAIPPAYSEYIGSHFVVN